jgi:uncharacterized protein (TIGR03437 family)
MRLLALSSLAIGLLQAQFTGLVAPGNGSDLYYGIGVGPPIPNILPGIPFSSAAIYRIGTEPTSLVIALPAPVSTYFAGMSPFLVSQPQFSRDSQVFAYTTEGACTGGDYCVSLDAHQTTVQGVPDRGTLTFKGRGWLSGSGRYLLVHTGTPIGEQRLSLVDLQTGQQQPLGLSSGLTGPPRVSNSGRLVADDGTAVVSDYQGRLKVFRGGSTIQPTTITTLEAVIDASGDTVVYAVPAPGPVVLPQSHDLRVYSRSQNTDTLFVQANGDTHAPSISADGIRVLFLSTAQFGTSGPPGASQLYAVNIDGTGFRELTSASEPLGVQQYTLSDDGQVAWYVSGEGSLVKLDISKPEVIRTVFHPPIVALSSRLVPGSAVTLNGAGITDASYSALQTPLPTELGGVQVTLDGVPAPLLSVSPSSIVFQTPWEIQPSKPVNLQVTTNLNLPTQSSVQGTMTPMLSAPVFVPMPPFAGAAIHQDWSSFVTNSNPARLSEIVHLYGTGFGPVQPAVATNIPAPADPPAVATIPLSCNARILYAGLAPGLVGYYQLSVQIPDDFSAPGFRAGFGFGLTCGPDALASIPIG